MPTRQSDAERKLYEQHGKSAEQFSRGSRHPSATADLFGSSLVKALGTPTLREGTTPHTEPCKFSERFVLTAVRINTPRMSQPFMVARSCTTSRHVPSARETHLWSRFVLPVLSTCLLREECILLRKPHHEQRVPFPTAGEGGRVSSSAQEKLSRW